MKKYQLVLASNSPRRYELIGYLNIPFIVKTKHIEETSMYKDPGKMVEDLARQKGYPVYQDLMNEIAGKEYAFAPLVVASDTLVFLEGRPLGKPKTHDQAHEMLMQLSGKMHYVYSGVYFSFPNLSNHSYNEFLFHSKTEVYMDHICPDLLEQYIQTGDANDKAGGYGIQGPALTFISKIQGSYSNVVGFPLNEFIFHLKNALGLSGDQTGQWRNLFNCER